MGRHYLKIAWRNIKRNKGYSFLNISGISIGLAAFWLIALYVADELSYDKFFSNSDQIFRVVQHSNWDNGKMEIALTSPPFAVALKNKFPEVKEAVRINIEGGDLINYGNKSFSQEDIWLAENTFFELFDYPFLHGNGETALINPGTMVITESLAIKIFGEASKAINKTIALGNNKLPIKITGVINDIPKNSHMLFSAIRSFAREDLSSENWNAAYLYTYLLIQKGTDPESFANKLVPFEKDLAKRMNFSDFKIELQALTDIHLYSHLDYEFSANGKAELVYLFIVIGFLVLLIAVINYMNLSTARAVMRVKEIGIRKVVGSEIKHLVGLFLSEAILVTFIASILACFIVQLSLPVFNQLAEKDLTLLYFGAFKTIGIIVLFTVLIGVLCGSYPALFLSRLKMIPSLKGQIVNMGTSIFLRKTLVVVQFVITVCLISGSYIVHKQMQFVSEKDLGFDKNQVLISHIDDPKVRSKIPTLKATLLQSPLVESAATAGNPLGTNYLGKFNFFFEVDGKMQSTATMANFLYIDEDFLPTNGMELLQGRNFSTDRATDKEGTVIINETLMKSLGYSDAIGKKINYKSGNDSLVNRHIIGVIKDFHSTSLQHKIEPMVLLMPPNDRDRDNLYIKISKGKALAGIAFVKSTMEQFDGENKANVHFLNENFNQQYLAQQKQGRLSLVFTVLAIIISGLGLLGLVVFVTAQRRKEIGIRKVLGASVTSVTLLLSKDFGKLVGIASLIALPIAWFGMNRWLQDFAYHIEIKWWMFLLSGGIALAIAMTTVSFQALKAAIANPVKSLRSE
ncbi:ABC transporter permease [Cyclobacterium sp. 1_MG-2023]|uniref:ABC transporter permease n=1 Tax=Cyclobacterium sp. 1_MG-2023 TaxID=3062681 RepID=UPI0026E118CF|nr:ABC transporter permease [Cyclobacterium sp. 1_MG-2023]MDO6435923.1 ABC transporter permease [Cyclobacterium sp. 1_MG-2023]